MPIYYDPRDVLSTRDKNRKKTRTDTLPTPNIQVSAEKEEIIGIFINTRKQILTINITERYKEYLKHMDVYQTIIMPKTLENGLARYTKQVPITIKKLPVPGHPIVRSFIV